MALYINGNKTGGGGGNTDILYLTQAEYDALPDSKLNDDKIYMIEDVTSKEVEGEHYSTDEQIVGTWIDGSTIYEKTFYNSNLIDTTTVLNALWVADIPSDADLIVDIRGSVCESTKAGWVSLCGISSVSSWQFGVHITSSHLVLYGANSASTIYGGRAIVTIKYTKSTT